MLNFCTVDPAKSSHNDMRSGVGKGRVENIFFPPLFHFIATVDYFLRGIVTKGQGDSLPFF